MSSVNNNHDSLGIWPESPSFSDTDMPAVPQGWKGHCQSGEAFNASTCNRFVVNCCPQYSFHDLT